MEEKSGSTIKRCTKCTKKKEAHFQDERYGKGIRLHNSRVGCTVCGDSKFDKLWAPSSMPHIGVRKVSPEEREILGHCAPLESKKV